MEVLRDDESGSYVALTLSKWVELMIGCATHKDAKLQFLFRSRFNCSSEMEVLDAFVEW